MDLKMFIVTITLGIVSFVPNKYTQLAGMIVFNIFFWNWKRILDVISGRTDFNGNKNHY